MPHSRSIHPAGGTDSIHCDPTVSQLRSLSTEATPPGLVLGARPFFQPVHEKSDGESSLQDWEGEGDASSHLREKPKAGSLMQALTYLGPGRRALEARPKPLIQAATDAIVRVTATTICGTDLHILKGDVPTVTAGRILGHEGVGIIEEVGASVSNFQVGAHVLISCITSCGKCTNCKKGMYSHCENGGGWILGNVIDGTQAEYVRIPYADNSLYPIPAGADEEGLVMLSDILPTGFECGVLNGRVKPGDTIAIVGAGPVGLAALMTSQLYSPGRIFCIDLDDNHLAVAKAFGATEVINSSHGNAIQQVMELTHGEGVDVAIEAVGI